MAAAVLPLPYYITGTKRHTHTENTRHCPLTEKPPAPQKARAGAHNIPKMCEKHAEASLQERTSRKNGMCVEWREWARVQPLTAAESLAPHTENTAAHEK